MAQIKFQLFIFITISILSQPTFAAFQNQKTCKSPYAQTQAECEAVKAWNPANFTPPTRLEGNSAFRIIYHSFSSGWDDVSRMWMKRILENPSLITYNPKISASVISAESHVVFPGKIGLILEAHPENIVGTSSHDVHSPRVPSFLPEDLDRLRETSEESTWNILTPATLIKNTPRHLYNEIILTGIDPASHREVRPVGLLVTCGVSKMTLLNRLGNEAFDRFLDSQCSLDDEMRKGLAKLRESFPIFAYSLTTFHFK